MATAQLGSLLRYVHKLAAGRGSLQRTDRELLDDFSARRDEAAFAALVARHGPMVLRVCQRVLKHEQDAEDAFQATFLILARKTTSIRKREALAKWLHGVAHRTALELKRSAARRRDHEARLWTVMRRAAVSPTWDDVQAVLDEEIQRLPETYRAAFVLCVLEGKRVPQAADELGVKEGAVWTRLTRARQLLQRRLTRRGIKLAAVVAAITVCDAAQAGLPAVLAKATIRFGLLVAAGEPAAGVIPSHVASLAAGVTRAMFLTKAKIATAVLFAVGLVAAGSALTHQALAAKETPSLAQKSDPTAKEAAKAQVARAADEAAEKGDKEPRGKTVTGWKQTAVLRGHEDHVHSLAFCAKGLLSLSKDGTIRLWNPTTGKEDEIWKTSRETPVEHPLNWLRVLPDGNEYAIGSCEPGQVGIMSFGTVTKGPGFGSGSDNQRVMAVASDGKTWAVEDKSEPKKPTLLILIADFREGIGDAGGFTFEGKHADAVHAAAFSPDDKTLATASADQTVKLWDLATKKERTTCKGHTQPVFCVVFAPDGKTLASGDAGGTVRLWDSATGKELAVLQGHEGTVRCLVFAPKGKILASACEDKTVAIWDITASKRAAVLKGHTDVVRAVVFNRDGTILASAGQDKEVRLWEPGK